MVPKGCPSVTGQEHDASLFLCPFLLPVQNAGSVVCNPCSLAIPGKLPAWRSETDRLCPSWHDTTKSKVHFRKAGRLCQISAQEGLRISVIALASLNERYYPKADTASSSQAGFFPPGQQSSHFSFMSPAKVYERAQSCSWQNIWILWDKNMCSRYIKSLSSKFPKESIQNLKCIMNICEAIEMSCFITLSSKTFYCF